MRRQATAPSRVLVIISTVVVALLLLFASGVFAGSALGADAGEPEAIRIPVTHRYEVEAGDSLWAIAVDAGVAGGDVRVAVEAIKSANGLTSSTITPGQVLILPAG